MVPNSVMTTLFSVMARTYESVLMNLKQKKKIETCVQIIHKKSIFYLNK